MGGTGEFPRPARTKSAAKIEKKTVEYATREWFPKFIKSAHFRIAAAVFFMTTTGARVGELCNLTMGDCMFDHERGPRALLRETKNGKPRASSLIPCYAKTWSS